MYQLNEFYGKTWIYVAQISIFGMLGAFSLICGPLFLFGIMKSADGRPATDAGIPMIIIGIALLIFTTLPVYNIRARREPIIRIMDQGLEINVIGSSTLDGISLVPGLMRVAWSILSTQGFRQQVMWVPWSTFRRVEISGPPMARVLTIFAVIYSSATSEKDQQPPIASRVDFREVEFIDSLDEVGATINDFAEGYSRGYYR